MSWCRMASSVPYAYIWATPLSLQEPDIKAGTSKWVKIETLAFNVGRRKRETQIQELKALAYYVW